MDANELYQHLLSAPNQGARVNMVLRVRKDLKERVHKLAKSAKKSASEIVQLILESFFQSIEEHRLDK